MADYSSARWKPFQYKVDELMQKPEFKHKPSPSLMKFLKNTDFLIPASEKERVLGVKQSDQDTVEVNLINKQSITTKTARAYNHSGNKNDSTKEDVTFITRGADFTYSIKESGRTIWEQAEIVAKQIISASIALHDNIETYLLSLLNTNKSQVVNSATPRSGAWDGTNHIFGVSSSDLSRWMQRVKGFMREQYYKGGMFDVIIDEYLFQEGEFLVQQGQGNNENLGWQAQGLEALVTQELSLDSGYNGMGYIFQMGTIGILPWIPQQNRSGFGDTFKNGGLYTMIPDPLGSGLMFAVHERAEGADNEGTSGETQDVDIHVELSIDLGPVIAPMSTANASPVYKFGVLQ